MHFVFDGYKLRKSESFAGIEVISVYSMSRTKFTARIKH